ncbi:DUF1097 domain-containing protein [Bradyrhizobium tropiciagri]|uniref:DUF1097 domain-containing protein n=1 Tax=Bradyrhizobium tropiciagri TaxID=312253 RepID=UPI001BA682DF|nr:DUF1097 domain-containing protein [Bradyrhizobium tropiciagri]MBR0870829.1 DUF1097 domain-containing protein [Bradyrhizobium tropiciagri]
MKFALLTLTAAVVASIAATASAGLGWPVWAMFVGWVAFFTGGHSARAALTSYLCVAAGIGFGVFAAMAVGSLLPLIDFFAFGVVVFVVAVVVVSLRAAPLLNNVAAYFLGLIAFFASHLAPGLAAFIELAVAGGLGTLAAWIAHQLSGKVARYAA